MLRQILKVAPVLISVSAFAEAPPNAVLVEHKQEKFDPNVSVSGQLRSGFMYESVPGSKIDLPVEFVYINLGSDPPTSICGKIITADGTYEVIFDTRNSQSGMAPFDLGESDYDDLGEYLTQEVAVLAYEGKNNCKTIVRIFPASWTEIDEQKLDEQKLMLYLNAGQFTTRLVLEHKSDDQSKRMVTCSKIEGKKQVAYDTVCILESDKYPNYALKKTRILRSNGNSYLTPIRAPISPDLEHQ